MTNYLSILLLLTIVVVMIEGTKTKKEVGSIPNFYANCKVKVSDRGTDGRLT
jgi:hypothetical protein